MLSKPSKWELGFVHYIAKFTISRFVISRFECTRLDTTQYQRSTKIRLWYFFSFIYWFFFDMHHILKFFAHHWNHGDAFFGRWIHQYEKSLSFLYSFRGWFRFSRVFAKFMVVNKRDAIYIRLIIYIYTFFRQITIDRF